MKAAVITRYGSPDVVKILDVPKPTPAAHEVLIRVHAATVNRTDCGELRAHPFFMRFFYGLRRPKRTIFGLDFAGEVEAVGAEALSFKPGDRVFGMCPSRSNGAQAEYVSIPERAVAVMPAGAREFAGNRAWAPKTLPVLRWQARQWQTETRSGSAEVIAESWPQEQEAVRAGIDGVRRGGGSNSDA